MKLPTIKAARALAPHRVEVIWSTGRIDKVNVGAALKAHASLAPALKKARFATVVPVLGVTEATLIYILGSLASALAIDAFGLLGSPLIPITLSRVVGIALAVIGFLLARR